MELISTLQNNNENFDVFIMDNKNKCERQEFFECFYSSFGPRFSLNENWFDWYYLKNPYGICDNYLLLNKKMKIIGAFGYAKNMFYLSNILHKGILGINGFINPNYAGRGLYTDLMINSLTHLRSMFDYGFSFPHGKNIGSIKGHIKSDWKLFKKAVFLKYPVNNSQKNIKPSIIIQKEITELFDYEFKKNQYSFFYKTFDWIKWRFHERPDKKYGAITISNETNFNSGYLIYTFYTDSSGKRCQVADYEYYSKYDFSKLLDYIIDFAISSNCISVEFLVNEEHEDTQILLEKGFLISEEHYLMFTYGNIQIPTDIKIEYGCFDVV